MTESLGERDAIPFVIQPAQDGIDLAQWAASNRPLIDELLAKHKSLLFRDFQIKTADEFHEFVRKTSNSSLLEYRDRSTPRETRGERVYTSTVYPAHERINLHNEGTYWRTWPLKIYFFCIKAAAKGGATPIADVSKVYSRIDSTIRQRFIDRKVMYVRNYNDGFGLPWTEVFQTADKAEVEKYCRDNEIEFEWKPNNRLRTRQVRPAVRPHPQTGEPLWFNHGAFFHVTALDPELRDVLLEDFKEDELPYNTFFGDGSRIDPRDIEHIMAAYRAEQVIFSWKNRDVLLQDNMAVAHAREPYEGQREVLVAMTEPCSG